MFTKAPDMSNVKFILAYLPQYLKRSKQHSLYGTEISTLYNIGEKYCGTSSHLFIWSHFYYFVITKTTHLINVKNKLVFINQYKHRRKHLRLYRTTISVIYNMKKKYWDILNIYVARVILYYFVITKTLNLSNVIYKFMYL